MQTIEVISFSVVFGDGEGCFADVGGMDSGGGELVGEAEGDRTTACTLDLPKVPVLLSEEFCFLL